MWSPNAKQQQALESNYDLLISMLKKLGKEESHPVKGNKIKSRKTLAIELITNLCKEAIFLDNFIHGAEKV